MKKTILSVFIFFLLAGADFVLAHQPNIIYSQKGDIQINNPEISQAFYDELKENPRNYFINSNKDFELYLNLLVPEISNRDGRYSAKVFSVENEKENLIAELDANSFEWKEFYEEFGRDYYLKGPELKNTLPAGKYKIQVFSNDNSGKYVLAVGEKEFYDIKSLLNIYWQLPLLKLQFFKSPVWEFFLTYFGIGLVGVIGALFIFLAIIYWLIGVVRQFIKHHQAKTLLLTSNGMDMKEEIIKLLQKPAYDITVAFITTASKPEEDKNYMKKDLDIMKNEMGFNVEEFDIDEKKEQEVMKVLELKDIIFVEGGNTFYLLNSMRKCNFEKVIRKLLKFGKVYVGASAGSMVAGKTIITSVWRGETRGINRNTVNLKNLKGLNLVGFDIFVHYTPEYAEIIKKKLPWKWQRRKLKIITDGQAILVQGREVALIGKGEAAVV